MKRKLAVDKLAQKRLDKLSHEERAEQLEIMLLESWNKDKNWRHLSKDIKQEFKKGQLSNSPSSQKYNDVLLIWLKHELEAVSNDYICNELKINSIEGMPIKYEACPCCGYRTIEVRDDYDICMVCWWEDGGQDNDCASMLSQFGEPNDVTLTQARINFLKKGIAEPEREDLIEFKHKKEMYEQARFFEIIADKHIVEVGTDWKKPVTTVNKYALNTVKNINN